jgi:hypothetical protein
MDYMMSANTREAIQKITLSTRTIMNLNDLFNAVMALDLKPIKVKLMHVESGEGWSLEKATAVEKEYRRFLCLMKMFPNEATAPLADVDTFWHYHILDTMKYAADCEQAFGYFLHHYPYVGLGGEDDQAFRLDSGNRMRVLYEATFGDPYPGAAAIDAAAAFCAGPGAAAIGAATAFCAGPGAATIDAATAFCAGPGAVAIGAATAFCAGPGAVAIDATTAFCAGPGAVAIDAATAFCAGPGAKATFAAGMPNHAIGVLRGAGAAPVRAHAG